jgi:hypothetical protein
MLASGIVNATARKASVARERPPARLRRPVSPLRFPTDETVPEGKRHLLIRTALFDLLTVAFGDRAAIGSDQFVYWNARSPGECLAPDVMVRLDAENDVFPSWKTWERGAPHLCVEVVSEPHEMDAKLPRYHALGVEELVAFDPDDAECPLRLWSRIEHDLVEHDLAGARAAPSQTLGGLFWVVTPDPLSGLTLRLSTDERGTDLIPTRAERAALALEGEARARQEEVRARQEETRAREAAEARIRELEDALARRSGG